LSKKTYCLPTFFALKHKKQKQRKERAVSLNQVKTPSSINQQQTLQAKKRNCNSYYTMHYTTTIQHQYSKILTKIPTSLRASRATSASKRLIMLALILLLTLLCPHSTMAREDSTSTATLAVDEANIEHLRSYTTDATAWFTSFGSTLSSETTSSTLTTLDMLIRTKTSTLGVVVFANSECQHSMRAVQLLSVLKIPHEVVYIDRIARHSDSVLQLLVEHTNQESTPYIWIGGEFIGGNEALRAVHSAGKLEALVRNLLVFQEHLYS